MSSYEDRKEFDRDEEEEYYDPYEENGYTNEAEYWNERI